MSAPDIVFLLMVLLTFTIHLRMQIPMMRAISRLNKQVKSDGVTGRYWNDWGLRARLLHDPGAIFSATDTPAVRALKQEVLDRRAESVAAFPKLLGIMVG